MSTVVTPQPSQKISFWKKIEHFFGAIFSASNEKKVQSLLLIVAPLVEEAAQLIGGPVAGHATEDVIGAIQSKLAAVNALVTSVSITGTQGFAKMSLAILKSVHDDLPQLLEAAEVKNSAHAATITEIVNTVDSELLNVFQALNGGTATA